MALLLAACGGGGGGGTSDAPVLEGARQTIVASSANTGTQYAVSIYTPPASAGARNTLPVLYVLDGESWFETLVSQAESTRTRMIVVAIHTQGLRSRDFVPSNLCTGGGGGHAAYFNFIRRELVPLIESTIGGDPARRTLFGHSHGGSFVLYAMYAEEPGQHTFRNYWASDASIGCMPDTVYGWDRDYAARFTSLPLYLHHSYASAGNAVANTEYAQVLATRNYTGLTLLTRRYDGTHLGIVPQVLTDATAWSIR